MPLLKSIFIYNFFIYEKIEILFILIYHTTLSSFTQRVESIPQNKMECQMSNYGNCGGSVELRGILFKYIDHLNKIPENNIMMQICNLHCEHMMNWNCNKTNGGDSGNTIIATIMAEKSRHLCKRYEYIRIYF